MKCGIGPGRFEQPHIAHVDHRLVRRRLVLGPDRPAVELLQRGMTRLHVGETANPDESIGAAAIAELPHDRHADRFLRFDEVSIEEIDQDVPLSRLQGVLTQLDHGAAAARRTVRGGRAEQARNQKRAGTPPCPHVRQVCRPSEIGHDVPCASPT